MSKRSMVMSEKFLGCIGSFKCEGCKQVIELGDQVYHFALTDKVWHNFCHDKAIAEIFQAARAEVEVTNDTKTQDRTQGDV